MSILAFSSVSIADDTGGFFLEPAITYQSGSTTVDYPAPFSSSKEDLKGLGLGLRIGGHFHESLFLSIDGRYAKPKYESSALGGDTDSSTYNAGWHWYSKRDLKREKG